ncbi:MAG TPA: flagellar filament capping protein FliD, partial [Clostridia bacterium]|nr:flagellar filament capping protein FliD [Clostridia bacterium]
KSLNTGTSSTITLVDDGSTHCLRALGFLDDIGNLKHVLQPAADAEIVIDGVTVTRSSNVISDAIPNVTLKLLKEGTGAATEVTVTTDVDAVAGKIKDFVNSYNAVMTLANTAGGKEGDLQGDFGLVIVSSRIRRGATDPVVGGTFSALWQVGVWTSDESGLLSVDEAKLKAELEKNPEAVKALFFTADASTDGVGERLSKGIADLTSSPDGLVYSRGKALSDMVSDIDKRVEELEYRLDLREEYLIRQFTAMEAALVQLQQHSLWLSNPWISGVSKT